MAYAPNRSKNDSLIHGTTEGKYFYQRPNTEDPQGDNSAATRADREQLLLWNGLNPPEAPYKDSPGR